MPCLLPKVPPIIPIVIRWFVFIYRRVPRLGNLKGEGIEPWALESRDLLRSRLVGRKVGVTVEYEKIQTSSTQPGSSQKRVFATVKVLTGKETQGQGKNVALMLVSEGVATCIKHRDGEERSGEYDSYLMAEAECAAKGLGLHGSALAPSSLSSAAKIQDFTTGIDCEFCFFISHSSQLRGQYLYHFQQFFLTDVATSDLPIIIIFLLSLYDRHYHQAFLSNTFLL